jgi:hypothetical protein
MGINFQRQASALAENHYRRNKVCGDHLSSWE